MVRAVLTMVVKQGCERAFEDTWQVYAKAAGELPGSAGQALARDEREPRRYVITGDWETRDALRSFESSRVRRDLSAALEPLRERSAKEVLEIVARI